MSRSRFSMEDDKHFPRQRWEPRPPRKEKHPSEVIREEREKEIAEQAQRGLTLVREYLDASNGIVRVWSNDSRTYASLPKSATIPDGPHRWTG